jgi:simple sugar transport system substrate-binding protein
MNHHRFLVIILLFAIFLLPLSGCEPRPGTEKAATSAEEDSYHFTFVIYGTAGNPFWVKVVAGAKEAAEQLGCKVDLQYAQNDPVMQNDILETAIANQVDGLGVSINQDEAYDEVIARAMEEGIPVIAFNNDDTQKSEGNLRMAFIGQDEVAAGYEITTRLIEEAGLKAGDHVVCGVEHPEAVYAVMRYRGVKKALDEKGITSEVLDTGAVSLEDTLNRLTQYLLGHKETDAIVGMGGMPLEMAPQASEDVGLDLPNAGFDITRVIAENIRDGRTVATVDQKPYYQGYFTVTQLYCYCRYGLLPCDIDTGGGIIDQSNVEKVIELADSHR